MILLNILSHIVFQYLLGISLWKAESKKTKPFPDTESYSLYSVLKKRLSSCKQIKNVAVDTYNMISVISNIRLCNNSPNSKSVTI